jgi:probable HAF family extracellular repeat protein
MKLRAIVGGLVLGWALQPQAATLGPYSIQWLDSLGGKNSFAEDINNAGMVVGSSETASGGSRATLWFKGQTTDLGTLGGSDSHGYAINASGVVVGSAQTQEGYVHATQWAGGHATDLGTLGGDRSEALGINDRGVVVGRSEILPRNSISQATLWAGGTARNLSPSAFEMSVAHDVNNAGTVVGTSGGLSDSTFSGHATRWQDGVGTVLPHPPAEEDSHLYAVNGQGAMAGAVARGINPQAAQWNEQGDRSPLPYLENPGGGPSRAYDINASGIVVGWSNRDGVFGSAAVWLDGKVISIETLLDPADIGGWRLEAATGINDNNWISGHAFNIFTYEYRGFLITPVPEPHTYAMTLMGLGLIWGASRKRAKADGR